LKVLGLGGVALTLPKPLSILGRVERPPLHFGRLVFPELTTDAVRFEMAALRIAPAPGLPAERVAEFFEKWILRVVAHDRGKSTDMLRVPTAFVGASPIRGRGRVSYSMARLMAFKPGQRLDCWLKPGETPRYPLPEVSMVLQGSLWRKGYTEPMMYDIYGKFQTVRMDRDEAVRMGICPAGEPVDDFAVDHEEEMADVE